MANQKSGRKPSKSTKSTKKTKSKSKGLGDTVEQVLEVTGIAKVAKWALGEDCGCDKRKEILNHLFPYNKPECLNEQEYAYLKDFYSNMCFVLQGIGAANHEKHPRQHVRYIVRPDRRCIEAITGHGIVNKFKYKGQHQPSHRLARPYAHPIDKLGKFNRGFHCKPRFYSGKPT